MLEKLAIRTKVTFILEIIISISILSLFQILLRKKMKSIRRKMTKFYQIKKQESYRIILYSLIHYPPIIHQRTYTFIYLESTKRYIFWKIWKSSQINFKPTIPQ